MSVQYTGGRAVKRGMFSALGDIMSTVGDIMSTVGDIMSTLEGVQYTGGYHEYTGGYHDKCEGRSLGKQFNLYGNPSVLNIPQCTEHPPVYS